MNVYKSIIKGLNEAIEYETNKPKKVIVLNWKQALNLAKEDFSLNRVIISIRSIGDYNLEFNPKNYSIKDIIRVHFNDIEDGKYAITFHDAERIAWFVKQYWNKVDQIVVHCDGGVSRSAGVAAAILKYFTNDDSEIFDNPNYYPNMMVYRRVLNALMEEE